MFRLLLQAVLLIAVIAISESNETQQDDVEKRGQQTLADVIKELNSLKTVVNKGLNGLKTGMNSVKTRIQRIESRRLFVLRGRDGRDGLPGPQGPRGRDGKNGAQGPRGLRGSQGPPGQQGPRGPPGRNGGGVEYIRWGKTSCPAGANKVYKGRIGGELYRHTGGASNYVCLPENPKYLNYKPGVQTGGYMYGTEYEVYYSNPFYPSRSKIHDHDAPCVVCHVKTRSAKLMIPATYQCPSGWTREYYGYLMSEDYGHKHSSEYICVDSDVEAIPGSGRSNDGALLYPVQGRCGSLPCLPYVEGRELTCVVCTK